MQGGAEEAGAEDGGAEGLGRRARRGPDGGGGIGDGRRGFDRSRVGGEWRRTLSPPDYIEGQFSTGPWLRPVLNCLLRSLVPAGATARY